MTKHGLPDDMHLQTYTTIDFSEAYEEDIAILEGKVLFGREMERTLSAWKTCCPA